MSISQGLNKAYGCFHYSDIGKDKAFLVCCSARMSTRLLPFWRSILLSSRDEVWDEISCKEWTAEASREDFVVND